MGIPCEPEANPPLPVGDPASRFPSFAEKAPKPP